MNESQQGSLTPADALSPLDRDISRPIAAEGRSKPARTQLNRWIESLSALLLSAGEQNKALQFGIFSVILLPVILLAVFGCLKTYRDLTESTFSKRQAVAQLAATALEQRFNRLTDIGVSLATRVRFRQLVGDGKWLEAVEIMKDVPQNFSFVDRAILIDPAGNLMADTPAHLELRGKNFATRDWYLGVSKHWKPYVSNVYQRSAEPRYNIIGAAVPIQAVDDNRVIGILLLQVQLNHLVQWTDSIGAGPSAPIYFIDQNGQLATHGKSPSEMRLDYSKVPVVQKVLRGESGVEIMHDPLENDERIAAYAPVPGIGWGVIAAESSERAFARRNRTMAQLIVLYGAILLISGLFTHIIWRTLLGLKKAEDEIHALNQDLRKHATEVEATNRELESFSYSVSHDLRAPLRAIDGFSLALLEDYVDKLDAGGKDFLERIRAASQRMAQLIDDLLNLSRVSRSAINRQKIDLSAIAGSIVDELRRAEPQRQVQFTCAGPLAADGDERLMRVALENLLGNAWKFTGKVAEAKLELGVASKDGAPAYFVRDNGAGFDMSHANKLFGPFQRLHAMNEFAGTGIGLATVQRIIHRHGGRVWAEAQVGQGATFYFTLN